MVLSGVWMKAAKILKPNSFKDSGSTDFNFGNDGIIFSKNNVCMHSTAGQCEDVIHNPGYLTIFCENNISKKSNSKITWRLSWIPNNILWHKSSSISELSNIRNDFKTKSCPEFRDNYNNSDMDSNCSDNYSRECDNSITEECSIESTSDYFDSDWKFKQENYAMNNVNYNLQEVFSRNLHLDNNYYHLSFPSSADMYYQLESKTGSNPFQTENERKLTENYVKYNEYIENYIKKAHLCAKKSTKVKEEIENDKSSNQQFEGEHTSVDVEGEHTSMKSNDSNIPLLLDKSCNISRNSCSKFSVDLGNLKSLRLFFNDSEDSGQLVITSRRNQFRILYFHCGGLQKLSNVLQQWNIFVSAQIDNMDGQLYKHFKICQPQIKISELHPEEEAILPISEEEWFDMFNENGQIEDDLLLRKKIFFGGLPKRLRKFVWPFLLNCYPYRSTYAERIQIRNFRRKEYQKITNKRKKILEQEPKGSLKTIEYMIEKDVVRTDRSNPFYAGNENPNVLLMKNVLLNYTVYDCDQTYMQGMSDLLAPILVEIPDEAEAFWCFVDIIKRGLFVCAPTDSDMEKNLLYLRELIRIMQPQFYSYLESLTDSMDLLFCHRWLLLCFKREFPEDVVLRIWEACWSNYITDYFHLFICLAIISVYADDIIKQKLKSDDILYHFNTLAMRMDGTMILKRARGLLYTFRMLDEVPSILEALCQQRESDIWESETIPVISC